MKNCFFSAIKAPLVLAPPVGATCQTRRIVMLDKKPLPRDARIVGDLLGQEQWYVGTEVGATQRVLRPRYRVGETCYVGEPYWRSNIIVPAWGVTPGIKTGHCRIIYRADQWVYCTRPPHDTIPPSPCEPWTDEDTLKAMGWRLMAGRFLPQKAARCWLKVLGVKVERLQQCSEEDAVLELVEPNPNPQPESLCLWRNYSVDVECYNCISARDSYYTMINAVDGPGTWAANPWVFAYTLQRVEKPAEAEKGERR